MKTRPRPRAGKLRILALVAAMVAVTTACGTERDDSTAAVLDASILTGDATTVSGDTVDLAAFADQDLVVWFWAPW